MPSVLNEKLAAICRQRGIQDNATLTGDTAQSGMPEFRSDGRETYRLIREVYDDIRASIWVIVEREGVLKPVIISIDRWKTMRQETVGGPPVGCA